jgi:effector-binding domain-containing protein
MTLMSIGRFAAAARLSIKALRIYDASGLLPAACVDSVTGYRYYGPDQLGRADTIRTLRSIDLPLADIAAYLNSEDPAAVLRSHVVRLEAQRAGLDHHIRRLTSLLNFKELSMTLPVTIKAAAAQQVACCRSSTTHSEVFTVIPAGFARVQEALADAQPIGPPFTVFHAFPDADQLGEVSMCIPVACPVAETDGITNVEVPAGAVASVVHRGSYSDMGPTYASIGVWIQEHGHNITGPSREVYLNNPGVVAEADLLTEIQWPIDDDHGPQM